jgi:hypothetical protein
MYRNSSIRDEALVEYCNGGGSCALGVGQNQDTPIP